MIVQHNMSSFFNRKNDLRNYFAKPTLHGFRHCGFQRSVVLLKCVQLIEADPEENNGLHAGGVLKVSSSSSLEDARSFFSSSEQISSILSC